MSIAFVFPGQGGQFVGMGRAWLEAQPQLKELFDLAEEYSQRPITKLCFEGPLEELSKTGNLQPAILALSLSALRLMKASGIKPDFVAGHSLGEFGALVAAGVFDEAQALELVAKRAAMMEEVAVKKPGIMMAVMGLSPTEVESICELARNEGPVVAANFNTPSQIVISGEGRAVSAAGRYIKMKPPGKFIPLPVNGAFHSELMAEAGTRFAEELEATTFNRPVCPVVPNCTGLPTTDSGVIKKCLISQIVSPVLWTKTVENLLEAGVTEFKEAWPKAYLGSMIKKCLPQGSTTTVDFQA